MSNEALLHELKAWQNRMEGLFLKAHEHVPQTYSEMFADMTKRMDIIAQTQEKTCNQLCELEKKLQPILEAQEGVSSITKLYRLIPGWLKVSFVGFISWALGSRMNF